MIPLTYEIRNTVDGVVSVVGTVESDGFVPGDGGLAFRRDGKPVAKFGRGSWDSVWVLTLTASPGP
jgi:hypothetical protein